MTYRRRPPPDGPGLRRELRAYARALSRGRSPAPVRFILFAQGRTGSTLLGELLGSHPDVRWDGEILTAKVRFPRLWVEGCSTRDDVLAYGFKAKIYQLTDDQGIKSPRRWIHRAHTDGWRLLYLWRRNVVRHVLSNMVRRARGRSHDRAHMPNEVTRVHVDPNVLLEYCAMRERVRREEHDVLEGVPVESFNYEDDLLDASRWQSTADRAFSYLGIASKPVATTLRKINAAPLEDIIENFTEVRAALAPTVYAPLLEQDP